MKVIVITATVKSREKSLFRCLSAIRTQTRKPDEIHIVPDDYKQLSQQNMTLAGLAATRVIVAPSLSPMGPACRWLHIDRSIRDDDAIVISVDDDVSPGSVYVQKTVDWVTRLNGVVTWKIGSNFPKGYIRLDCLTGHCCAMRSKYVRGISKAPLAKEYFRRGFPVDVLVMAYFRSKGVPLWAISDTSINWTGYYQDVPMARTISIFSNEFKSHLMKIYKTYGFISSWGLNPTRDMKRSESALLDRTRK